MKCSPMHPLQNDAERKNQYGFVYLLPACHCHYPDAIGDELTVLSTVVRPLKCTASK
jgi:hypothetical protein